MPEGKYLSAFPKEGNRIRAINDFMQPVPPMSHFKNGQVTFWLLRETEITEVQHHRGNKADGLSLCGY